MPAFTIGDIVRGSGGALLGGDLGIAVAGISIDSRSLGVGEAFFAIRGERLDGHGFLRDAVGRGVAVAALVAALRRFDLDDVGAEVREQRGTERPGEEAGQVEDANAGERAHR